MAVIQPYFTPDSSVGQSIFAIGWNTFLKERTAMNLKIMDQMLRQADPSYLFDQIATIDQNILEYEKLKNDLSVRGSSAAMEFAQARQQDAYKNADLQLRAMKSASSKKSDDPDYTRLSDLVKDIHDGSKEFGSIINAELASIIKDKEIDQLRAFDKLPLAEINKFIARVGRSVGVKPLEDKDAYNVLVGALNRHFNDNPPSAILKDAIEKAPKETAEELAELFGDLDPKLNKIFITQAGVGLLQEEKDGEVTQNTKDQFEKKTDIANLLSKPKTTESTESTGSAKPKEVFTANYFKDLEDFSSIIADYEKKIKNLETRKASLQGSAAAKMQEYQQRSPFEPFKRNYVTENPFKVNPYQEFLDEQQAMIPSIPGIQFNQSYDLGSGNTGGLTTQNGMPVAFLKDATGQETFYKSGDNLYESMLSVLNEVGKTQQQLVE